MDKIYEAYTETISETIVTSAQIIKQRKKFEVGDIVSTKDGTIKISKVYFTMSRNNSPIVLVDIEWEHTSGKQGSTKAATIESIYKQYLG